MQNDTPLPQLAQRMAAVLVGNASHHYTADFRNLTVDPKSGKRVPQYERVDRAPGPEDFERHLRGEKGLLVVPIAQDGSCRWGKIDIDDYSIAPAALAAKVQRLGLPLAVELTKSGGVHLAWYLRQSTASATMRAQLAEWAAMLGFSSKVEIFPKQDKLSNGEHGSGINLPYFGGAEARNHAVTSDGKPLSIAQWLDMIERMPQKVTHVPGQVNVEAAIDLLAAHWTEGQRDNLALAVAGTLLRAEVEEETVQQILDGAAQAGDDHESRRTASSVQKSIADGKRVPGYNKLSELIGAEAAREFMRLAGGKAPPDPLPLNFDPLPTEWITVAPPPLTYCIEPLLPTGTVGLLVAEGGTGKTTFALRMAMSVATGRDFFGLKVRQGRCVYIAAEEHEETLRRRLHWIFVNERRRMQESGCSPSAIEQMERDLLANLTLQSAVGYELHLVASTYGHTTQTGVVQALIERLPRPLELLIMDPLSRLNGAEENSNAAGTALVNAAERITRELRCTALLAHHTGKISAKERDTSLYAARGASGLVDAARSSVRLLVASKDDVRNFSNVPADVLEKGDLVQVVHNKSNEGPRSEPFWLRRQALDFERFDPQRSSTAGADHFTALDALFRWYGNNNSRAFSRTRVSEAAARSEMFAPLQVSRDIARTVLARALDEGDLIPAPVANAAGAAMLVFRPGFEERM